MDSNVSDGVVFLQPTKANERQDVANACALGLNLTIPILVDGMDNAADIAYNGCPERLYVLSTDGAVVYQGGKGPYGFKPEELAEFLAEYGYA